MNKSKSRRRSVGRPSAEAALQLDAALIAAASELFFTQGFSRTSIRDIAAKAGVTRQTLYARFPNKMVLFEALMEKRATELLALASPLLHIDGPSDEILRRFAAQIVDRFVNSDLQRIHQMVIAEADTFPALAKTFYERGPGRGRWIMKQYLQEQVENGYMKIDNLDFASEQFFGSLVGPIIFRSTLALPINFVEPAVRGAWVDHAVTAFLTAYGTHKPARSSRGASKKLPARTR